MSRENMDNDERLLREAFDWRERLDAEDVTEHDRNEFQHWLDEDVRHKRAYKRANTYVASFDFLKEEHLDPKHLEPLPFEGSSHFLTRFKSILATPNVRVVAMLMAILLITAPVLYLVTSEIGVSKGQIQTTSYVTQTSERRTIRLGDGTAVTMDASTEMIIAMSDDHRSVRLVRGAALFDVSSDPKRPFSVSTSDLKATAKGTEFDIRSNGGVYRVGVAEGSVEVSFPHVVNGNQMQMRKRTLLAAGEQVAATNVTGMRTKSSISTQSVGAWRQSILLYDGATLGEMIADANRYSEREIVFEGKDDSMLQRQMSGSFRSDDVMGMLNMVSLSFDLQINDGHSNRIVITSDSSNTRSEQVY
ncbi:MAG: FecR domain-containing protein [Pseudomonadota bacterium]